MAEVNCRYCKKKFDRDKEPFIQIPVGSTGTVFRYAHADCYNKEYAEGKVKEKYKIWNPATSTTCFWCHKALDKTESNAVPMSELPDRWVHSGCALIHPENDYEKLMIYIIQLYKLKENYIPQKLQKQVTQYENEYEYTYSGMQKALHYWYEIKKNPIDRNRGIGIIPRIYAEAKRYYYSLYLTQLQNEHKDYKEYVPEDIEIKISPPKKKVERRKLFTFLEEDDIE